MVELKYGQEKETGQVAISLMPNTDGMGSGSLLDSTVFTLSEKQASDVLSRRSFFLSTDDTVAPTD